MAKASFTSTPVLPKLEPTLRRLVELFQAFYYMPDPGALLIALAVYVANRMSGNPLWLMIVGPPSGGKTEQLNALLGLPDVHSAGAVKVAGLLSGTTKKNRSANATGGLLKKIGERGVLILKDFTSILSLPREALQELLAALREIYDGRWIRPLGVDGGQDLIWEGKLAILAAVTSAIDRHTDVMAKMGERFLYYRMPEMDGDEQEILAERALNNCGIESESRDSLSEEARWFLEELEIQESLPEPTREEKEWLMALSTLTARCRSAVDRHSYNRDIEHVHSPEAPARLAGQLNQLLAGLRVIGVPAQYSHQLVRRVALDCIPPTRLKVLSHLASQKQSSTAGKISHAISQPLMTTRRALEDLEAHQVVFHRAGIGEGQDREGKVFEWALRDEWLERWKRSRKVACTVRT